MKQTVLAAIAAAINAYMEQEGQAIAATSPATPYPATSPWRTFGRHELMRARSNWQVRRHHHRK